MAYKYQSVQHLKQVIQTMKANPDRKIQIGYGNFMTGIEYVRWFRDCLNKKINRNLNQIGRKYSAEYQIGQLVDARIIRERIGLRIVRSGTNILRTLELKRKYPDIDNPIYEL